MLHTDRQTDPPTKMVIEEYSLLKREKHFFLFIKGLRGGSEFRGHVPKKVLFIGPSLIFLSPYFNRGRRLYFPNTHFSRFIDISYVRILDLVKAFDDNYKNDAILPELRITRIVNTCELL